MDHWFWEKWTSSKFVLERIYKLLTYISRNIYFFLAVILPHLLLVGIPRNPTCNDPLQIMQQNHWYFFFVLRSSSPQPTHFGLSSASPSLLSSSSTGLSVSDKLEKEIVTLFGMHFVRLQVIFYFCNRTDAFRIRCVLCDHIRSTDTKWLGFHQIMTTRHMSNIFGNTLLGPSIQLVQLYRTY